MNENEAIPFTQKHENLLLKHTSEILELKGDVEVLKADVEVLKAKAIELKSTNLEQEVLREESTENLNRILEVVKYNYEKYVREIPPIKEKLENHSHRISALEFSIKN